MSSTFSFRSPMNSDRERSEPLAHGKIRRVESRLSCCGLVWARLHDAGRVVSAILREIFDESAYARFLSRHQLQTSRANYAAFRKEHEKSKALRPRCC